MSKIIPGNDELTRLVSGHRGVVVWLLVTLLTMYFFIRTKDLPGVTTLINEGGPERWREVLKLATGI